MARRVNVALDDDLYDALLARGGGERKVSGVVNDLIRKGLATEAAPPDPQAELTRQVAALAAEVARLVAVVTGNRPQERG
jgi:hypothetical protein